MVLIVLGRGLGEGGLGVGVVGRQGGGDGMRKIRGGKAGGGVEGCFL